MVSVDQDLMDDLYSASIQAANELLLKNGEFFPFAHSVAPDEQIGIVAYHDGDDSPESQSVIDNLKLILSESAKAKEIVASAIAVDVRITDPTTGKPSDAVMVQVRSFGYARNVIVPYEMTRKGLLNKSYQVQFYQPHANAANEEIFID